MAKIEKKIKSELNSTPYVLEDFSLKKGNNNKLLVSYHRESTDFRFSNLFYLNYDIEVSNNEDFVDLLLEEIQKTGKDLLIAEKEAWRNYPVSDRKRIQLPKNTMPYLTDYRINLRSVGDYMENKFIMPMLPKKYPQGINIIYDHQTPTLFREEYQFNYENSTSVGPDNNPVSGWISHLTSDGDVVAKLSSNESSIRLTTFAMRFMPKDFKSMKLDLKVTNNVKGANVLFGGSGLDDSAFQIWYTIRVNTPKTDRSKFDPEADSVIFGYYWGDEISGKTIADGEIYENYYSKKNFIIAVLPEAKQLLIGHKEEDLNKFKSYEFNIYEDLKKAFPDKNVDQMEIIGITIQHDSNDSKDDSEAFFKQLQFKQGNP